MLFDYKDENIFSYKVYFNTNAVYREECSNDEVSKFKSKELSF